MRRFVLYHANCFDGFGAAWAAWRKFGRDSSYLPVRHGNPPPALPRAATVFILDFCYPRAVIVDLAARMESLTVIDHHKTAEAELVGLDFAHFDNEKSGAVLSWEYFHPGEPVPELLRYVMDRDLWRHELPRSREVSAALSAEQMDFELWSRLEPAKLAVDGASILRYQRQQVGILSDQARFENMAGYRVPVANAPLLGSEVGEELLRRHPDAPFAAMYFDRGDGVRQWSLRSRPDFDVSEIARRFANGGHRQASGFESHLPENFVPKPKPARPPARKK